eukprot:3919968-Amphidinium_carterae.1
MFISRGSFFNPQRRMAFVGTPVLGCNVSCLLRPRLLDTMPSSLISSLWVSSSAVLEFTVGKHD